MTYALGQEAHDLGQERGHSYPLLPKAQGQRKDNPRAEHNSLRINDL